MKNFQKILIPILIIAVFFLSFSKIEYAAENTLKIGDINGDGLVDSRDTLRILEHIAASTIPQIKQNHPDWILTGEKFKVADINEDGIIDSRDTLRELEYIAASTIPTIAQKHPDWKTYIESKWIVEATGITLDKTSITIEKGSLSKLTATITPINASNKAVTWNSSDTKVATVDGLGNVAGKSAGIAVITAKTSNGKIASAQIKVTVSSSVPSTTTTTPVNTKKDISKVSVALSKTSIPYNGKAQTISVTLKDGSKTLKNGTDYTLAYSNNKNVGTATIKITGKGNYKGTITKNFKITEVKPTNIKLKQIDRTIAVGTSLQLNATITPTNVTNKTITWSSSDNKIAKVSNLGLVSGIKPGKVTITAKTANNKKATCTIRVNIPIKSISLNKTELTIDKGKSYKFNLTFNPSDATDKTISWYSTNTNIVEVNSNGEIKAKSQGTANITAVSKNGKTTQCKVIVEDNKKAEKVIAVMKEWKNMSGSKVHEQVYKYYNSTNPKHKIKWDSQWCSETVSAAFAKAGMVDLIGGVSSCTGDYKSKFKKIGIKKDSNVTPKPGWVVCYGSGTGHTALVIGTSGSKIRVLAGGNSGSHGVHEKSISKSSVKFYGAPRFSS